MIRSNVFIALGAMFCLYSAIFLTPSLAQDSVGDSLQGPSVPAGQAISATSDAGFFPASSVFFAEVNDPQAIIALVLDHPLRARVESIEAYKAAITTPAYRQFSLGRMMVEGQLKMPWREALETLLGRGLAFGFDVETNGFAAILHGKDPASMKLLRDRLLEFARLTGNQDQITEGEYRGVQAIEVNEFRFAVYQDRLLITNQGRTGKWILDRMIDTLGIPETPQSDQESTDGLSLLDNPRFQSFRDSLGSTSEVNAFLDLQVLGQLPAVSDALQSRSGNPVVELLIGGVQSALVEAGWASAHVAADAGSIEVSFVTPFELNSIPEQRDYFFGPEGDGRGPSLPSLPDALFTLSTHRDFSDVWLRAGDLFDANVNDGIAQADATLTTLFAGRDFGEDILAAFEPEVGFVAVRQNFADVTPRPTIKLPAFAMVFELKEPATMKRELRRTFQSLIGFLNVVGAMNGQRQLELGSENLGGHVEVVSSSYVPEQEDLGSTDADLVFNFSPSVAYRGKQFIVSSSNSLARQLVDAPVGESSGIEANTSATLYAAGLKQILKDNREQLIAQRILEDGNTREEAAALIDLLLTVVGYFSETSFLLGHEGGSLRAAWQLKVLP